MPPRLLENFKESTLYSRTYSNDTFDNKHITHRQNGLAPDYFTNLIKSPNHLED